MKTTPMILAMAFVASAMVAPVSADTPGNYSVTFEFLVVSYFDFKDGVGIYDGGDPTNTFSGCLLKLLGLRIPQPIAETWEVDQNMGTNLNGPAIGISDLGLSKPGGIDTGIPCPPELDGIGNIFLTFSGMNWRSVEHDSSATLTLCTQKNFVSSSPGCLATPEGARLFTSACHWDDAYFGADYTDNKGKYLNGQPFDDLLWKSDQLKCGLLNWEWFKTVNWTDTIQDFTAGQASQTFDLIKNENAVPYGSGHSYMAVCWDITYFSFQDPFNPTVERALAHDWKLILDVDTLLNMANPNPAIAAAAQAETLGALQRHYGGAIAGDNDVGGDATRLRGFYSQDAGNPKNDDFKNKGLGVGQNGFPCEETPDQHHTVKAKKPTPIL